MIEIVAPLFYGYIGIAFVTGLAVGFLLAANIAGRILRTLGFQNHRHLRQAIDMSKRK